MKLVKAKFDFIVEFSKAGESKKIREGSLLKVNGFNGFAVFINPPFDIDDKNYPINFIPELGLSVQPDIFALCFDVLTDEEEKQIKL